jgi:hypothetical protein
MQHIPRKKTQVFRSPCFTRHAPPPAPTHTCCDTCSTNGSKKTQGCAPCPLPTCCETAAKPGVMSAARCHMEASHSQPPTPAPPVPAVRQLPGVMSATLSRARRHIQHIRMQENTSFLLAVPPAPHTHLLRHSCKAWCDVSCHEPCQAPHTAHRQARKPKCSRCMRTCCDTAAKPGVMSAAMSRARRLSWPWPRNSLKPLLRLEYSSARCACSCSTYVAHNRGRPT